MTYDMPMHNPSIQLYLILSKILGQNLNIEDMIYCILCPFINAATFSSDLVGQVMFTEWLGSPLHPPGMQKLRKRVESSVSGEL